MANTRSMLAMFVTASGLAACGGSGGGDGGGNGPGGGADLVTINSESAPLIAESVADAVVGGQSISAFGGLTVPTPGVGLLGAGKDVPQTLAATFGPETVDCAGGGRLTTSATLAVPESVTVGDTISFVYVDCNDGAGAIVNGSLDFEIVAFSGDANTGMVTLTVSMTLGQLEFVEEGVGGGLMDGDLSFTIDTTNTLEMFVGISSTMLTISSGGDSTTLRNYMVTMTIDQSLGTLTLESSATLSNSALSGEFSYVTETAIVFGEGGPTAGRIVVTGDANATLTINVVTADQVELELDEDGNGTVDVVLVRSWTELTS